MNVFQKKSLPETKRVCFRLKEARLAKDVSLSDLAKDTKINKRYLKALEECRFQDIPCSLIYKKSFIKRYAQALDIDPQELVAQFIEEEVTRAEKDAILTKTLRPHRLQNVPLMIHYSIVGSLVLLCLTYLGFQIKRIVDPPALAIYAPTNGLITTNQNVIVSGKTDTNADVSINGETIMKRDDGKFVEPLTLSPGVNTITISAQKKHGKSAEETVRVILNSHEQFTLVHPQLTQTP